MGKVIPLFPKSICNLANECPNAGVCYHAKPHNRIKEGLFHCPDGQCLGWGGIFCEEIKR